MRYCEITAVARFLSGRIVRAVWCEFELADGIWSKPRLLLCSHAQVSGVDVILGYARRCYIEPVFDDVKNRWGWKKCLATNQTGITLLDAFDLCSLCATQITCFEADRLEA